jgi:UDP-N-acetylmuramoyl-L-alanyl-D-glutamate--2,6-diaminopimelate ligase
VFDALGRLAPVRGRLERAGLNRAGAPAYVDYAHTPDALEAAIAALRARMPGAPDRGVWRGRRPGCGQAPPMGRIAATRPTSPSSPMTIRAAKILPPSAPPSLAACETGDILEIGDRRAAIAEALRLARRGDVVLIAGGHEQGQIVGRGADARVLPR